MFDVGIRVRDSYVITSHPTSEGVRFSQPLQLRQTIKDLQQVLPIPSFSPIVSPTYETPNQEGNQNHSPTESSSTQNHSPTKSPSPPVTKKKKKKS